MARLLRQIIEAILGKYDSCSEKGYDSRQSQENSQKVDNIASKEDKTGLLDMKLSERFKLLEDVT